MQVIVAAVALLLAIPVLHGQPPAAPAPDLAMLGPQVGERVPDFRLPDQHGRIRDLESLLGPNGAMLVFFRSAEW